MRHITIIIILAVMLLTGCSSNQAITPNESPTQGDASISSMPVGVSDFDNSGNPNAGMGVMGLYSVHIDPLSLENELTSLRSGSITDVLEVVDITNFLQVAPCSDCVRIAGVELDLDGNLVVNIGIRHPFEVGDPFKPITGRNRADLHVFNVEGIVVSDGASTESFAGLGVTIGDFQLLNADGLTSYLDDSLDAFYPTNSDTHPFITHFDDYTAGNFNAGSSTGFDSVVDPPPSGNLVMAMGSAEDIQDYVFAFPGGDMDFIFAVGCTYAVSAAGKAMRFTPEYRVPQHNKKAASYVNVVIDANDLAAADTLSEAQFTIEVLDISHGIAVGDALDEMLADSSVSGVEIEIAGVTLSPTGFSTTPTGGDGRDPANPLTFTGTVLNEAGAAEGTYTGIVKVTDSYSPGLNESPLLGGMDGITRVGPIDNPLNALFEITEFATYQRFEIYVETGNEDPIAILNPDPALGCVGGSIWFDGGSSYDTDGSIATYEFDFDWDGVEANFVADESGIDSRVETPAYNAEGNMLAGLRVIDDFGASAYDSVNVTISAGGSLDVSGTTKSYVTDTSFSNIIFTPNNFLPLNWSALPRPLGMEAMATGSQYVYAVFYAIGSGGEGVYIARSGDDGSTWGDYEFIHAVTASNYGGVAITAVGDEVFINVVTQPLGCFLYYNSNHGSGTFVQYEMPSLDPEILSIGEPSVVVDPTNTDNIFLCFATYTVYTWRTYTERAVVFTSNTGPSGTFTASPWLWSQWGSSYYRQTWSIEAKYAPDGDIYVILVGNYGLSTYKSADNGANWDLVSHGSIYTFSRHSDYCFDPDNPETIMLFVNRRYYNTIQYYRSTNGGASWAYYDTNFQNGTGTAYSNVAVCTDILSNVYTVFTDVSSGNADVWGRFSSDNGSSFGSAIQISDDPNQDGHCEVTRTTSGCDVVIGWLEDRDGTPRVVSRKG